MYAYRTFDDAMHMHANPAQETRRNVLFVLRCDSDPSTCVLYGRDRRVTANRVPPDLVKFANFCSYSHRICTKTYRYAIFSHAFHYLHIK